MRFVIMPDRLAPDPVDALAVFSSEADDSQPLAASAPLRGPWDSSPLAVMPISDSSARALIRRVQAVADKVDVLSITIQHLARWIFGLAVLAGLLMLALLAQTYLWLTGAHLGR